MKNNFEINKKGLKFVKVLFLISFFLFLANVLRGDYSGLFLRRGNFSDLLYIYLPPMAVFLHGIFALGLKRAFLFLFLAVGGGFLSEFVALNFGVFPGGSYIYNIGGLLIFGVPVSVLFYWFVFIYTAYFFSNSFLVLAGAQKPGRQRGEFSRLLWLVFLDACLVLAIDLVMDPIMVEWGMWSWQGSPDYFKIPFGNFWGWFFLGFSVSFLFRFFEYLQGSEKLEKETIIVPTAGYYLIFFSFLVFSLVSGPRDVFLVGAVILTFLIIFQFAVYNLLKTK